VLVVEMKPATGLETTWETPSFTGGIEAPGSVSVVVKVIEVVIGVSLGLGDGQR
jgi:hypothetical protein